MGQGTVHPPADPVQVGNGLGVLGLAGHFLRPPGSALYPEGLPCPPLEPVFHFKVRGGRVKDAVLNVMGGRSAHGEPGQPTELIDLSAHQMEDVFPHRVDPAAAPPLLREGVEQGEVVG